MYNPYTIHQQQQQQQQQQRPKMSQPPLPEFGGAGNIFLSLQDASNFSKLCNYLPANSASLISKHIEVFLPFASQYDAKQVLFTKDNKQILLCIDTKIHLRSGTGATNNDKSVRTVIVFHPDYADKGLAAFIIPSSQRSERVKQNYFCVNSMGQLSVETLISSGMLTDPYNVHPLMQALEKSFNNNYPFEESVNISNNRLDAYGNNVYSAGYNYTNSNNNNSKNNSTSNYNVVPNALTNVNSSNDVDLSSYVANINQALANDVITTKKLNLDTAAEKVVIDLNMKATEYLTIRKQTMEYMEELQPIIMQLGSAKSELEKSALELKKYIPVNSSVAVLLKQLEGRCDTLEEHEKCLVAENDLQTQELELTAELQASADALNLLQEGLKSEILTCEEYVKQISDIGREQFFSRFLQMRVVEKLAQSCNVMTSADNASSNNDAKTGSNNNNNNGSSSDVVEQAMQSRIRNDNYQIDVEEIPQKLSPISALEKTFPNINRAIISDVVDNLHGDVKLARLRLQSMSSFS